RLKNQALVGIAEEVGLAAAPPRRDAAAARAPADALIAVRPSTDVGCHAVDDVTAVPVDAAPRGREPPGLAAIVLAADAARVVRARRDGAAVAQDIRARGHRWHVERARARRPAREEELRLGALLLEDRVERHASVVRGEVALRPAGEAGHRHVVL